MIKDPPPPPPESRSSLSDLFSSSEASDQRETQERGPSPQNQTLPSAVLRAKQLEGAAALVAARPITQPIQQVTMQEARRAPSSASAQNAQPLRMPPPAFVTLHGEVLEHEPPRLIRARYPIEEAWLNPYGVLQGGILSAMFDNAIGMLCFAHDPARASAMLEMSVRFFRSIRTGWVIVDGSVVRAGRTTITIDCVAWDEGSEMCARSTSTSMFLG